MTKACPPTHHRQLGARNHFLNDRPAQQLRAQNESDDNPAWIATRSEPATSVPIEEPQTGRWGLDLMAAAALIVVGPQGIPTSLVESAVNQVISTRPWRATRCPTAVHRPAAGSRGRLGVDQANR